MDAATAAVLAGALGAGITVAGAVGAQLVTHLGANKRDQRSRLYDSLSVIYVEAYAAIADAVAEARSGERSEPSPWARLDRLQPQISFLGSGVLDYEIAIFIADATEVQETRVFGEESAEYQQATDDLHKQAAMIRNLMRRDLGLPPEGDANALARQVLERRHGAPLHERVLARLRRPTGTNS